MSDLEILSPPPIPPPLPFIATSMPPAPSLERFTKFSKGEEFDYPKTLIRKNLTEIQSKSVLENDNYMGTVRRVLSMIPQSTLLYKETDEKSAVQYFSFYRPVIPVIQHGPSCGLAALCMGLNFLYRSDFKLCDVLAAARDRGFTKQGEMFSAVNLLALAQHLVPCSGSLIGKDCDVGRKADIILTELGQENVILMPYDKDNNHEPCLKRGQKAHWALLTGFVIVKDSTKSHHLLKDKDFSDDEIMPELYHLKSNALKSLNVGESSVEKFVYAFHGQSLRCRLWSMDDVLSSNAQLVSLSPEMASQPESFVLPSDGIASGLSSQFVILKKTI